MTGNATLIARLDARDMINRVTGQCYCNLPELTDAILTDTRDQGVYQ